ncbi:transcriptional repressor LexA [Anaerolineae bacterium CFX9]|nr:transcriptional repressor LexA [Anaerolineae bacterium CFX9]
MRDRTRLSERQRNILIFMERYLETHGFPPTIREIGEATGINSTSVVNYNLNKLVSAGYLSRSARASRGLRLVKQTGSPRRAPVQAASVFSRVPVVGTIVASAPVPIPEDMGHHVDEDEMIQVTPQLLHGADPGQVFALKVKGDSMIDAMICDGDIVLFRRQEAANNGEMVAVWLDERNETTLKYFYREGSQVRLQPAHPTMAPIYVDAAHCHIQGRVLSVIRPSV